MYKKDFYFSGKTYNIFTHTCNNNVIWNEFQPKCGNQYFDQMKQFCLNNQLYTHTDFVLCNGNAFKKI